MVPTHQRLCMGHSSDFAARVTGQPLLQVKPGKSLEATYQRVLVRIAAVWERIYRPERFLVQATEPNFFERDPSFRESTTLLI